MVKEIKKHFERLDVAYRDFKEKPDEKNFNDLAMECFQLTNYLISWGERLVEEKNLEEPLTYAELVDILERATILTYHQGKVLKKAIYLRNLVAHEYYKISTEELEQPYSSLKKLFNSLEL